MLSLIPQFFHWENETRLEAPLSEKKENKKQNVGIKAAECKEVGET